MNSNSNGNGNGNGKKPAESAERKYLTGKISAKKYADGIEREAEEVAENDLARREREAALA